MFFGFPLSYHKLFRPDDKFFQFSGTVANLVFGFSLATLSVDDCPKCMFLPGLSRSANENT